MLKDFFADFKVAVNDLSIDFVLTLIHPRQWTIAKIIAGSKNRV